MPVFQEKKDILDKVTGSMEAMFTAEGRQSAREQRELARAPKGQEESMAAKMTQSMKRASGMFIPAVTSPGESIDSMANKMEKMTMKMASVTVGALGVGDGGGASGAPTVQDPVLHLPPRDPRIAAPESQVGLAQLCVRLKNLKWSEGQVKSLEDDVNTLWRKKMNRPADPRPTHTSAHPTASTAAGADEEGGEECLGEMLVSSQMALHHGAQQLIEYIGIKIVFFDLREDFVARLYYPSPAAFPLSSLLEEGGALDESLAQVSGEILSCESLQGCSDLMRAILERVCEAVVQALEWSLVGEPMGYIQRRMAPEDAQTVVEDLMALKRYFVQRDADGTVYGLDEERVASKTARLEMLANNLLSLSTERMIELYFDRYSLFLSLSLSLSHTHTHTHTHAHTHTRVCVYSTTPEASDITLIDRKTIVGALSHRHEQAAQDLVKDIRKQKK